MPGGSDSEVSRHPTDRLIVELIRGERRATEDEVAQIVERVATASFDARSVPVRMEHRGLSYGEDTLADRAPSLLYHLMKRTVIEGQWAHGTTDLQYVRDLHRVVVDPTARLSVFRRRSGQIVTAVTATNCIVPAHRQGPRSLPYILVVYSADRGIIISGYQISELAAAAIPEEARWLK